MLLLERRKLSKYIGEKISGKVIKTKNNYGVCALVPTPSMQRYLSMLNPGMNLLDIGCGYGTACTLPALKENIQVHAIDIDPNHLALLHNICKEKGYKATVIEGRFPEIDLETNYFDAIVAHSSLQYLNIDELKRALLKIKTLLRKDGTFFIMVTTPYMKIFSNFLPVYLDNKEKNIFPAGRIEDSRHFIKNPLFEIPQTLTLFDKEELLTLLTQAHFRILECEYSSMNEFSSYLQDGEKGGVVYAICSL